MGSDISKQLVGISGKAVFEYSVIAFSKSDYVKEIIITAKADELDIISGYKDVYPKIKRVAEGGKTRQESVANALKYISEDSEIIAIHDAARPLISTEDIDGIISQTMLHGAVCPVSRVVDTVKKTSDGVISETLNRESLFLASTPQTFKTDIYKNAFYAMNKESIFTDDCSIVELSGQKVYLYIMENDNTKITTAKDLAHVKSKLCPPSVRVGHGYDVHKLVTDRKLILGGVDIPHTSGLLGHSDADVLVHAIMDALLGAAGMGDIGKHFPDTSDEFKDISSLVLLKKVSETLERNSFSISNIDATIVAQSPKLAPYIHQMIINISDTLNIPPSAINIKATTEEKLGFTGEKLGIASHAVCILMS